VFPPYVVSPLDGLRAALGSSASVDYALGVRAQSRIQPADIANLSLPEGGERGIEVRFLDRDGALLGSQHRYASAFNFLSIDGIALDDVHAFELRCTLTAPTAGEYTLGASGVGRFLLTLDGEEAFDAVLELDPDADPVEGLTAPPQHGHRVRLAAGQQAEVVLRWVPAAPRESFGRMLAFQLNADLPYDGDDRGIETAVALAALSDAVVVVVGTTEEVESEGFDRTTLGLPGRQDELVRRVAAVNERTVVVVNSGAPVLMPWRDDVAAVLVAWFPGQEFGNALADVVLGAVEPGGRLPTTWPAERDDTLPSPTPVDGELAYDEGLHIGYRRYLRVSTRPAYWPAYWFGHGLGYTRWEYRAATVDSDVPGGGARVTVDVRNVGERPGRDVVQVYLVRPDSAVERPGRWLAGFAGVEAGPGESATVVVDLPLRRFAHWDTSTHAWAVEPGTYHVLVGASVDAIHCTATAELPGGAAS
jgi:beta-glucosidase